MSSYNTNQQNHRIWKLRSLEQISWVSQILWNHEIVKRMKTIAMGEIEMQAIQLGEMKHASKGLMRIPCFFCCIARIPKHGAFNGKDFKSS